MIYLTSAEGLKNRNYRQGFWNSMERKYCMSKIEQAMQLLKSVPEYKMGYVIAYLQGIAVGEDVPNSVTLEAFEEGDRMLSEGTGKRHSSVSSLIADLED